MTREKEIKEPDSCWNKAKENELVFVLLGRDIAAPYTIRQWAKARIELGLNQPDDAQIKEALGLAACMEEAQ